MPKVKCASCGNYVNRDDAIRMAVQSVCKKCGVGSLYTKKSPKKSKKPDIPDKLRKEVHELDGRRCRFCGTKLRIDLHHVFYRSELGPHEQSNLISLCKEHHDVVHSDKTKYQPLCLGIIWLRSMGDKQILIPVLERKLNVDS